MPRDVPSERRSWLLRRRAMPRRPQLARLFASLCGPALGVGAAFLYLGYWHMLAFALLETTVLAACLRHYGRHFDDYDRIDIAEDGIVVEQCRGGRRSKRHLDPWSARLAPPRRDGDPICLRDDRHGRNVAFGRFLGVEERRRIATELAQCLRRH